MPDLRLDPLADTPTETLLAAVDNALRNGSYMTKANLAFDLLCDRLNIDRDDLNFDPGWPDPAKMFAGRHEWYGIEHPDGTVHRCPGRADSLGDAYFALWAAPDGSQIMHRFRTMYADGHHEDTDWAPHWRDDKKD